MVLGLLGGVNVGGAALREKDKWRQVLPTESRRKAPNGETSSCPGKTTQQNEIPLKDHLLLVFFFWNFFLDFVYNQSLLVAFFLLKLKTFFFFYEKIGEKKNILFSVIFHILGEKNSSEFWYLLSQKGKKKRN